MAETLTPGTGAGGITPGTGADGELRRRELADFLRTRRERITPEQVGLIAGGRRRTPGLRREELAQLAGVGVTWYTWLEQARDIHASDQVLDAISRTLRLDRDERAHLFTLAGASAANVPGECNAIEPGVHAILDRLGSYPGAVQNGRYDILAFNPAYAALVGDLDGLPFDERNILWLLFTSPAFRSGVVDWRVPARRGVAQYRARMADHTAEPAWRGLVRRLQAASPEFDRMWSEHDVAGAENYVKEFSHYELGLIRCHSTALWFGPRSGTRLVAYTPADELSAARLEALPRYRPLPLVA